MTDAELHTILDTYPDKVAEALGKFKTATVDRERLAAKLYLQIKAEFADDKITVDEIKARVKADEGHYRACLEEIIAESEYTALYEKLLCAKRESGMRTAF